MCSYIRSRQLLGKQQIKRIIDRAAGLLLLPAVSLRRKSGFDNSIIVCLSSRKHCFHLWIANVSSYSVLFIGVRFVRWSHFERERKAIHAWVHDCVLWVFGC